MDSVITPAEVRDRATAAHVPFTQVLARAGVADSTFFRWEKRDATPRPYTIRRISDALDAIEQEKRG